MRGRFEIADLRLQGLFLISIAVAFLAGGCAITGAGTSLCDSVPAGQTSVICKIAADKGISVEAAANILKLGNVAMLDRGEYTAREAQGFIKGVMAELEDVKKNGVSISYGDAIKYLNGKKAILSPAALAAFEIINPGVLSAEVVGLSLCEYDIDLVILHLERQLDIVRLYM